MSREEKFAAKVYRWSAYYGIAVLALAYLQSVPDPFHLTHLGFVGTAMVFQGVFLVIAKEPRKYMALMPVTFFEKLCFGVPAIAFSATRQVDPTTAVFGAIDLVLMFLFILAWSGLRAHPA